MAGEEFYVKMWGTRGTICTPGSGSVEFGGNTSCVEIRCSDRLLVFDAGAGIMQLGENLLGGPARKLDLFFTHCHYDHIEGLPFFAPLYEPDWTIDIWSGHLAGKTSTHDMVCDYMSRPYFPISPEFFRAAITYHDMLDGADVKLGDEVVIRTCPLNHPDGAIGYRVEHAGRSICYVTDTEHVPGKPDQNILALIEGADIVIYDSSYSDETFDRFVGYGHSTWQEGVRLCDAGKAGTFVAFHHMPGMDDASLNAVQERLTAMRPGSLLAREGMVLRPR